MTTKKESPSKITKHKSSTAHKKSSTPQAFDIMPRNKVRLSANSRPVIPSSKPAVADNTLTMPSTAPQLSKHKIILDISKPASSGAAKSQGVSVTDLIAKRSGQAKNSNVTGTEFEPSTETDSENDDYFLPVEKPAEKSKVAATEPEKPSAKTEQVIEPPKPELTDEDSMTAVKQEVAEDTRPEDSKDAGTVEDIIKTDDAEVTEAEEDDTSAGVQPPVEEVEEVDALADVLKEDEPEQPQTHSQSFKEALKDMKDTEASIGDDGRAHHELYGGKPVIVIHKDRGAKSVLAWLLWFIICLLLALVIVNFLLDAEVISTNYSVPHTDIL